MSTTPLDGDSLYAVQECSSTDVHPFRLTVKINGRDLELEIDTCCGITLVPEAFWVSVNRPPLTPPTPVALSRCSPCSMRCLHDQVRHAGKEWRLPVMVAKGKRGPLFGRNWISMIPISWPKVCRLRSFPTVEAITKLYPDLCAPALGTINTGTVKLEMSNNQVFPP